MIKHNELLSYTYNFESFAYNFDKIHSFQEYIVFVRPSGQLIMQATYKSNYHKSIEDNQLQLQMYLSQYNS